jgi:Tol biopolymer transport system component
VKNLLLTAVVVLLASTLYAQNDPPAPAALKGPYLGQKLPGKTPELFAPYIVSTGAHEFSCAWTPDGKEFYFAQRHPELNQVVLMVTKLEDGVWTKPDIAPFVERQVSFEPAVSPDGKRLYFSSGKPAPGATGPSMNTLYVERDSTGWGMPTDPGPPFNPMKTMRVSIAANGTIYATDISEGPGKECIAFSRRVKGQYLALERMGPPINGTGQSMYPFIAPDESYLIFSTNRPAGKVTSVLLVSFRKPDGSWGEPQALDLGMDAALPFVTSDGKFLFFTGGERGKSDIYWVSASVLDALRPKAAK